MIDGRVLDRSEHDERGLGLRPVPDAERACQHHLPVADDEGLDPVEHEQVYNVRQPLVLGQKLHDLEMS